jgi:hypothetical protein
VAEVPATATPLASTETAPAFIRAWAIVFGTTPSRTEAEWLLALLWNENARGRAIIQHNWGNLSTHPSRGGDYWRPPWFDRAKVEAMEEPQRSRYLAIHERMLQGQEPEAFSGFADHETGARAWVSQLRRTFPSILKAAKKNSAVAMQDAVFQSNYCTSPACATIAPSYRSLRDEIRRQGLFASLPAGSSSSGGGGFVLLLGAGALLGGAWWAARKTR